MLNETGMSLLTYAQPAVAAQDIASDKLNCGYAARFLHSCSKPVSGKLKDIAGTFYDHDICSALGGRLSPQASCKSLLPVSPPVFLFKDSLLQGRPSAAVILLLTVSRGPCTPCPGAAGAQNFLQGYKRLDEKRIQDFGKHKGLHGSLLHGALVCIQQASLEFFMQHRRPPCLTFTPRALQAYEVYWDNTAEEMEAHLEECSDTMSGGQMQAFSLL